MPHISSKQISKELSEKLLEDLIRILGKPKNGKIFAGVVEELLTETEKIMMAKRIAIVLMLSSNTPHQSISDILKVSPATISKISLKIEIGKYDSILKVSQKERLDLERVIWSIMTVGGLMPPKIGRKYWKRNMKD
jgi:uncharacterized protein YerC